MKWVKKDAQENGDSSVETVVQSNTAFALALYQQLRIKQGNLFVSPYSISTALAMTSAGARGNTAAQMAQTLGFRLNPEQLHPAFAALEARLRDIASKGQVQLKVANALWPQEGYALLEEFLKITQQFYGVQVTPVNYGDEETARRTINTWVEDKTEQKIKDIIPPGLLDDITRLVLTNAIYFKGNWASQFDQSLTSTAPFRMTSQEQVEAPMMTQTREFRYGDDEGLQMLELPYAGDDVAMLVLLPRALDGLAELEQRLTVENLDRWTTQLSECDVQVSLPRFEITFPFTLNETLQALGMVDAFTNAADFSGMTDTEALHIAAVLHKAFVAVNEEGTEAAAAAAVIMKGRGLSMPPTVFCADHPFVFLIREKSTGSVLFLGRCVNPMV